MMTDYYKIIKMLIDGHTRRNIATTLGVSPKSITKCKIIIEQNLITAESFERLSMEQICAMIPQRKTEYDTKSMKPDFKTIHIALVKGKSLADQFNIYTYQCELQGKSALKQSRFYKLVRDYEATARGTSDNSVNPGDVMYVTWLPVKKHMVDARNGEEFYSYILYGILPYSQQILLECTWEKNANMLVDAINEFFVRLDAIPKYLIIEKGTSTHCKIQGVKQLQPQLRHMLEYYGISMREKNFSSIVKKEISARIKPLEKELITLDFYSYGDLRIYLLQKEKEYNSIAIHNRSIDSIYNENELPFMRNLPDALYELYEGVTATVQINCHIFYDKHWYSVPWKHCGETVEVRGYEKRVEIYADSICIANHHRILTETCAYSTIKEHMPTEEESKYLTWNKERFISWAGNVGPNTKRVIEKLLNASIIEQQAYRSCLSILHMSDNDKKPNLEQACKEYLETGRCNMSVYRLIKEIIKNKTAD